MNSICRRKILLRQVEIFSRVTAATSGMLKYSFVSLLVTIGEVWHNVSRYVHMLISYLARLPDRKSFRVAEGPAVRRLDISGNLTPPNQTTRFLLGRFTGEPRDLCRDYYTSKRATPPYQIFANSPGNESSIVEFTAEWGPLLIPFPPGPWGQPVISHPIVPLSPPEGVYDFEMDLSAWTLHQQRMKDLLALAARKDDPRVLQTFGRSLSQYASLDFDSGKLRLGVASVSGSVKFTEKRKWSALRAQLVADSLWAAFCAMLWIDVITEGKRIEICANPKCLKTFTTERLGTLYCCHDCGVAVARRKWWRTKGAAARKAARGRTPQ